jgi:hypothetical protein
MFEDGQAGQRVARPAHLELLLQRRDPLSRGGQL